ncbi:MAG: DNA mismatch repair protein MutS [Paludibacteraceae bacterium]|nr:DNA mismatch repair protein MutS [Paludibacteraceae bacterium]MBQ7747531.1 DNA mismatch repair protein MutS [Paludibacteraceae bacterium]
MAKCANSETPMMKQFNEMKLQHPDAILLFRCGDFYETYSSDAVKASEILGITLTKRANGGAQTTEMAGFPHHALDTYLPKLVRAGLRVAICDQLEDPKLTKKLVKRGITELITPGVSIDDNVLNYKENNFLAAIHFQGKDKIGVAFLDISTGEFLTTEGTSDYIEKLLNSFQPKEVLHDRNRREDFIATFGNKYLTYEQEDWIYTTDAAMDRLLHHFETNTLKGFGVESLKAGIIASGAILYYLDHTHHQHISHITSLSRIDEDRFVWLDRFTVRNLELYGTSSDEGVSLLDVLDKTSSPMGARMLKRWIAFPLNVVKPIKYRLEIVDFLLKNKDLRHSLTDALSIVGDMERITSKIAVGRVSPRELSQLRTALNSIGEIHDMLEQCGMQALVDMSGRINKCSSALRRLTDELSDDPPALLNKGGVIRPGYNKDLDELRDLAFSGKDYINRMEQRETELTGIPSLKIGFNNVFGYYIEVRNAHKDKVPEEWIRKQTLVNAERYITQELKEYEEKVLGAQEKIDAMEGALYRELVESLNEDISLFQVNCNMLAQLDCLLSFARVAEENHYVCPEVNDSLVIDIKDGRHPVIEKQLPIGESYISNDVFLNSDSQQIIMITGPNMAGKSALLRQTALIVLMAQIGCFVPARSASIGVVDKIFTRVGASDNISMGESTFMVEMNEAASILNNISKRSLVLFDELGRGTSTYDGISIAWSIVEYIHENSKARAKTLFATHYHELNEMEKTYERVKNFNVQVKEINNKVVFLRKLTPGGSEHSFGIHVAKMAGMPRSIVERATKILKQLEKEHSNSDKENLKNIDSPADGYQLSIFQLDDPVLKSVRDEIVNTDIDNLTPIEALNKLYEIKKIVTGKENK